ncbi:transporter substrate-binding domain-containing protein [Lacisediminimonas profundi]|uniref:transporter substrate-binding domain-containing protein n=1 Tax=Lacisediminimonas profundi TaxID=2603856 RepID=UPI00124B9CD5
MATLIKSAFLRGAALSLVLSAICGGVAAASMVQDAGQQPADALGAKARTHATIEAGLAEDIARRLPLATADSGSAQRSRIQIKTIADLNALPGSRAVIPVKYSTAPMAILRTDTSIRSAQQLAGQTVCLAEGGNYAGLAEARYGAIEKAYPSLTDALVSLRTGACAAVVHDSTVLEELSRLPEWKKFSAQIPLGESRTLALVLPAADTTTVAQLKQAVGDWNAKSFPDALVKQVVRGISSDVHLTQRAPDAY